MGNIYTIYLRQPRNKSDQRTDPLYNQGCFGSTGCHSDNVLKTENEGMFRKGNDRLCFMQGGSKNTKIVYITPPILDIVKLKNILIIKWDSGWDKRSNRPLRYEYGLQLKKQLARKLNREVSKNKPVDELYQHFRRRIKHCDKSKYLWQEYKKHITKIKKTKGNEIFIAHNHETFEFKNEFKFYNECMITWCFSECSDKKCERRVKSSSKNEIKSKYVCKRRKVECKRYS